MNQEQHRMLMETHRAALETNALLHQPGGLVERMSKAEAKITEHDSFKSKVIAWSSVLSITAGIAAQWVKDKLAGE